MIFLSAYGSQFEAKQNRIVQKNATIHIDRNHLFGDEVANPVILQNFEQQLKNSSYISKLEPFSQKLQEILVYN